LSEEINLQKGQPLVIKAEQRILAFVKFFGGRAYKKHSGEVDVQIYNEPELRQITTKAFQRHDFEWKT
jgi:leucyl aminopeptidase (aminopeptidase T)